MGKQKESLKTGTETPLSPPPHGWINELAAIVGCDRATVRRAIFDKGRGTKAEKVRQLYRQKYMQEPHP